MCSKTLWSSPSSFCLFFHKKFDTRTWSIVFASIALVFYSTIFSLVISYSLPSCFCEDAYPQLTVLPSEYIVAYVSSVTVLLIAILSCILAIYGTIKVRVNLLIGFISVQFITAASILVVIAIFIHFLISPTEITESIDYVDVARLILKENIAEKVAKLSLAISSLMESIAPNLPGNEQFGSENTGNIMESLLNDFALGLAYGMKLLISFGILFILSQWNIIFICGFLISLAHYIRYKNKIVKSVRSSRKINGEDGSKPNNGDSEFISETSKWTEL